MTTSTLAQTPASSTAHPIVPRKIQGEWARSSERALVPSVPWLVKEMSRYLAWGYDPVREAHTRKAQEFFERARATGVALH